MNAGVNVPPAAQTKLCGSTTFVSVLQLPVSLFFHTSILGRGALAVAGAVAAEMASSIPPEVEQRIDESGLPIRLEIDGGVKVENIGAIAAAGADTFVAGSAIFDSDDYEATIAAMRAEL